MGLMGKTILFAILHPAHYHMFKIPIKNLKEKGFNVVVAAREKDCNIELLKEDGIKYILLDRTHNGILKKAFWMIKTEFDLWRISRRLKVDMFVGPAAPQVAHVAWVLRKPYLIFMDTENADLIIKLSFPFAAAICTPSAFTRSIESKRHVRYDGFHELSYLHPNHFRKNPDARKEVGLKKSQKLIIVRLVSWSSTHDSGGAGIRSLNQILKRFSEYGKVILSSEDPLPQELRDFESPLPAVRFHEMLAEADLSFGESATITSEAAVLGVPAIYVSTTSRGYTEQQQNRYGLVYHYNPITEWDAAVAKAVELLKDENTKNKWAKKRADMLKENIDVAEFITSFIEKFPQSLYEKRR